MVGFFQHDGECGAGAAAVVEALAMRRKFLEKRGGESAEELTVAGVLRGVFVQIVLSLFLLYRRVMG